ncbi:MAG: hypothetical protein V3R89_03240 [Thermoanaerobaculia bacterium]
MTRSPESPAAGPAFRLRWLVGVVAGLAILGAAERGIRTLLSRHFLDTQGARWIWAPGLTLEDGPVAFYLVREFELDFRPQRGRLLSLADEEYVASLNGSIVGSDRYAEGAPMDVYEVGPLLRPGRNRLVVELRSSRGVGGLLLSLEIPGSEGVVRIVSDGDWGTVRRHRRRLSHLETELEPMEPAYVWGAPPAGRWGSPKLGDPVPLFSELRGGRASVDAERALVGREAEEWVELGPVRRGLPTLDSWVTFDWGREVTGYLSFRFPPGETPVGLIFVGERPPYPEGQRADAYLIAMPGRRSWGDTEPRTFRYVTLVGVGSVTGAQVFPTDPVASARLIPDQARLRGVFGFESMRLRTPLENKIWSKLQGVASGAGGEVS